jgi:cobalt-precorrin-5B (C1)-methyltransferase
MSSEKLKKGFTTGAAAAAAVKACLLAYFSGKFFDSVEINFLNGETGTIRIACIERKSGEIFESIVIKDAGDDPDITHRARIGARVRVGISDSDGVEVAIGAGEGVGRVTKPGLELAVGEPAINPGPRKMIMDSVSQVLERHGSGNENINIEIFVPEGEILAQKTLNARLGIVGGISILGTTGIVKPMSHEAYIATIKSSISVAAANGITTLVFTTGRRSERFAMKIFKGFRQEAFIQTGDFFRASLDMAVMQPEIETIVHTVFFGKAVKMALGFEHTHAAKSQLTFAKLASWAFDITGDRTLRQNIENCNTARHAFSYIYPGYPELISHVGKKICENALRFSGHELNIRAIILDFDGNPVFESDPE